MKKIIWVYSKDEPTKPSDGTDPQPVEMTNETEAEWLLYREIPSVNNSNGYGQKIPRPVNITGNWTPNIDSIEGLIPIIKCFNNSNEEILADIGVALPQGSQQYIISNIPSCVSYLMVR